MHSIFFQLKSRFETVATGRVINSPLPLSESLLVAIEYNDLLHNTSRVNVLRIFYARAIIRIDVFH